MLTSAKCYPNKWIAFYYELRNYCRRKNLEIVRIFFVLTALAICVCFFCERFLVSWGSSITYLLFQSWLDPHSLKKLRISINTSIFLLFSISECNCGFSTCACVYTCLCWRALVCVCDPKSVKRKIAEHLVSAIVGPVLRFIIVTRSILVYRGCFQLYNTNHHHF